MSIEVTEITKQYGAQKALDSVSFSVGSGSITGFLGPNGAGKSTMMKILTCFLPQNSGTAKVCGFDVHENSYEVKQHVGYLPEHNPLYLDMYFIIMSSIFLPIHSNLYQRRFLVIPLQENQFCNKQKDFNDNALFVIF